MELPERFWVKVDKQGPVWNGTPCWVWQGTDTGHGYGQFWWQGRMQGAHRVAYLELIGPLPDGLELDHLCRNRLCVNPVHLEPVTHQVNVQRGEPATRRPTLIKRTWPPCALCADPDGRIARKGKTPWRIAGARFGVAGELCYRCYNRLQMRACRHRT